MYISIYYIHASCFTTYTFSQKDLAFEYAQLEDTLFLMWLSLNLMYFLIECFIFLQ